jgi:hypothetical protein
MQEDELRLAIGLLAYVLNRLIGRVGLISVYHKDDEARMRFHNDLDELQTLTARILAAFPPPPPDGNGRVGG